MDQRHRPKIILSGGGTGGSVTPLLAVAAELLKEDVKPEFIFVGSEFGPEKELLANFSGGVNIKFISIAAGKWRRYLSWRNLLDVLKIGQAFFQSLKLLRQEKPDLVMSAGSFVSVPLVWAAACRRIPILIHQQDIRPGLANKLMAPLARVVTISFEKSFADYGPRAVWTGNPVSDLSVYLDKQSETRKKYNLQPNLPLILVIGGGTGALAINKLIKAAQARLANFAK
jgi:UDP-N-acetylglucosamine--N-acetylmuramyl-(pentapeptide) pyrophosphoryl-undecaprenol N-acetylglucosamine transferase